MTHTHPNVKAWLKRHKHFHMRFIPTGIDTSRWLNVIKGFFRNFEHHRLRRGVFCSVPELIDAISACLDQHIQHIEAPTPFARMKAADQIIEKIGRARLAPDHTPTA